MLSGAENSASCKKKYRANVAGMLQLRTAGKIVGQPASNALEDFLLLACISL